VLPGPRWQHDIIPLTTLTPAYLTACLAGLVNGPYADADTADAAGLAAETVSNAPNRRETGEISVAGQGTCEGQNILGEGPDSYPAYRSAHPSAVPLACGFLAVRVPPAHI